MRILIVEDDFGSREFLYSLIKLEGYDVKQASNGEEGLEVYKEYHPDLVISDIQMPKMDGLEMLSQLRSDKSDAIFIITTAFGSEDYAIEALRLGANNYLKKPIDKRSLLGLIKKYKSIVDSRTLAKKAEGRVVEKELKIEFDTHFEHISSIVSQLISEISLKIDDSDKTNIELGLDELITNSIEHGNLDISYEEKVEAVDKNTLVDLYNERLGDPELAKRKVIVNYTQKPGYSEWLITDEGKGFDWKSIPDPTQGAQLMELNGRGIFITNFLFDEMEYLGRGNQVRVRKLFN
ncbi:MAG: response regulator [Bacteroidales bacterium]|nr:response regulator [Bacteroidales bacterium]